MANPEFTERSPTNLTYSIDDDKHVNLEWKSMSKLSKYVIERKEGFSEWQVIADVDATSYSDSTIVAGKYYKYRIRGYIDA